MLNKRTQILFDKEVWIKLSRYARVNNVSVGELIRAAVEKEYAGIGLKEKRAKAIEDIISFKKKYGKKFAKGGDSLIIIRKMREDRTKQLFDLLRKK